MGNQLTIKGGGISQAAVQALIDASIADVKQFKVKLPNTFFNDWLDQTILNDSYFSGTGSADFYLTEYRQQTGATAGSKATSYKDFTSSVSTLTWDKPRHLRYDIRAISPTNNIVLNYYCSGAKLTENHIGFEISGGKLKATVGNGTAQSTADILLLAAGGFNHVWRLEAILTPGEKCEFYKDGVLVATITTNLPSGTNYATQIYYFRTGNDTSAENKTTNFGHVAFFQDD